MASQSLAELARTAEQKAGKRTPAQESHFLYLDGRLPREARFSRLVMEDLKDCAAWPHPGAGADPQGCLSGS